MKNRRGFSEIAQSLLFTALKDKQEITFALIDIDFFKAVNDTYGHEAGDKVLKAFAKNLSEQVRDYDIIGRVGGEEFAIILPETDLAGAADVAERIRNGIGRLSLSFQDKTITTSASVGVAVIESHNNRYEDLISNADTALYQAKALGRDRICLSQQQTECIELG